MATRGIAPVPHLPRAAAVAAGILVAGVAALGLAYWFSGDRPRIPGLPTAGAVTEWGLPVVRLLFDLCAVGTAGTLLAAALLRNGERHRRIVARWALAWAATAAATELLTYSDFAAKPVVEALREGDLSVFVLYIPQGRAFLIVYLLTLAIAFLTFVPVTARRPGPLLVLAIAAVLPPAFVGHSGSAAEHELAIVSLMLHLAAGVLWVGGLFGLLVFVRKAVPETPEPIAAIRRFSTLALCCFTVVGVSGVANAWVRLGTLDQLWNSRYGMLVLGKVLAMLVLGYFGWRHRRTTIARFEVTRAPFLRLAAAEIVIMAATIGLAVALSRTPPPAAGHSLASLADYASVLADRLT